MRFIRHAGLLTLALLSGCLDAPQQKTTPVQSVEEVVIRVGPQAEKDSAAHDNDSSDDNSDE